MVNGATGIQEAVFYQSVHEVSPEPYPSLPPSCFWVRGIVVPFSGNDEEGVSSLDKCLGTVVGPEPPSALVDIHEHILLQNPSFLCAEHIARRMLTIGVGDSREPFLHAYCGGSSSPQDILLVRDEIFNLCHRWIGYVLVQN